MSRSITGHTHLAARSDRAVQARAVVGRVRVEQAAKAVEKGVHSWRQSGGSATAGLVWAWTTFGHSRRRRRRHTESMRRAEGAVDMLVQYMLAKEEEEEEEGRSIVCGVWEGKGGYKYQPDILND